MVKQKPLFSTSHQVQHPFILPPQTPKSATDNLRTSCNQPICPQPELVFGGRGFAANEPDFCHYKLADAVPVYEKNKAFPHNVILCFLSPAQIDRYIESGHIIGSIFHFSPTLFTGHWFFLENPPEADYTDLRIQHLHNFGLVHLRSGADSKENKLICAFHSCNTLPGIEPLEVAFVSCKAAYLTDLRVTNPLLASYCLPWLGNLPAGTKVNIARDSSFGLRIPVENVIPELFPTRILLDVASSRHRIIPACQAPFQRTGCRYFSHRRLVLLSVE